MSRPRRVVAGRDTILVTGAASTAGSRLVPRLLALRHPVRAAGRRASELPGTRPVLFDWHDPATHDAALPRATRLYLVPPTAAPNPAAVMLPFLTRTRTAGVRRAVLLSSSALPACGPGVGQVHAALQDLFDE
ncbi:SDR family oxidoreductase [Streptomyces libani]|uniref:SDR family oxidoreductase n=1 Tax=Streptomyces nigrescens TaxID=1920 RepID=UPI00362DE7D6